MKPTVEELSKFQRKLTFQIPAADVTKAFEGAYKDIQKNVQVKGFRKGKVPMDMVKNLYKDNAHSSVIQNLVEENFFKALDENKLDPINQPQVKFEKELAEGNDFHFSLTFEVHPEVDLKKYEGLAVQKEKLNLDESEVQKTIDNLLKNQAESVPVLEDRPAQLGDIAVVDFEGFVEGKPLENGKGENHPLELGTKSFIEGFEEAIVGMKTGVTINANLKFPDQYHAADIAGKPVQFKITLKELKKNQLPELNDEFAKKVGFDTVDALKVAIKADYSANEEKRIQEDFKNRLLKELTKSNPMDVPATLVEKQKKVLEEDMQQRMSQMGMNEAQFKDYVQKWGKDFDETAAFIVQSSYLVNKIAEKESLAATMQDVEKKIEDYIQQTGIEPARIRSIYDAPENRRRLMNMITEEKVIDFLSQKANVSEVPKDKLS
jgi:trigger factor